MYADIDIRCRILVVAMKTLAKACRICEVYKGSLSSYAYTNMVIHYLQQTSPPVLPVLQEVGGEHRVTSLQILPVLQDLHVAKTHHVFLHISL